jgi:hypothetical protein
MSEHQLYEVLVLNELRNITRELIFLNRNLTRQGARTMTALTDLQAQVAANTTVTDSAVTLIQGLKASLDAAIASGDPAALTALSAQLGTETQKLADAVSANTPVDPTQPGETVAG